MDDGTISRELPPHRVRLSKPSNTWSPFRRTPPNFHAAMLSFLQATTLHIALVSVAQARQIEDLSGELDELREEIAALRRVH
jgi:hypothetical protein